MLLTPAILGAQQTIDLRHNQASRFWEHSTGPTRDIHTDLDKLPREERFFAQITLDVIVTKEGRVDTARAIDGPHQFFAEAEQIERKRTYRPFTNSHGNPIQARIEDTVTISPPEKWRTPHEPFPIAIDATTLSISLKRTICMGTCPIYTVTIHGDGHVDYNGENFVHIKGKQTTRIAPEKVQALLNEFRHADFLSALDNYSAPVTDLPSEIITLSYNGKTRKVSIYAPGMSGTPDSIAYLPKLIDDTANTATWIGDGER